MNTAKMWITTAHARTLGYSIPTVPQDSTIYLNIDACNLDRVTIDPTKYVFVKLF